MHLTMDTGAPMDVEFKMSTIKEEIMINNVDDFFSDDIKKSGDIVKDVTRDIAENNDELKHLESNNKIAKDNSTASNAESVESEKSTSDEPSRDDCKSKDQSRKSDTIKQNKPEDIDNYDLINQHQEPESQNNLNDHSTEENVVKTDTSEKCDSDISEQKSNVIVPKAEVKDQIHSDDSKNINNHEDTNDNKTDSEDIIVKATEIIEKTDAKQTNNNTKNSDTESLILDKVIDEVPKDEKKDHYHEDVTESQRENTVSSISPKINNDENKSTDSEIAAVSTLESTFKVDKRTKESKLTDSTSESTIKADNSTKESETADSISVTTATADNRPKESEITDSISKTTPNSDNRTKESEITDSTSESTTKADDSTKESEITDSTSESTSKADNSTKQSEITEESPDLAEIDTNSNAIEIEDEKINDTETHNKGKNENVESNLVKEQKESSLVSKLTNILDLLSDDEEEGRGGTTKNETPNVDKQCISLVDDDDVMLIDEDTTAKDTKTTSNQADKFIPETCNESTAASKDDAKYESGAEGVVNNLENKGLDGKTNDTKECSTSKPLLSFDFLNNCKKKLEDMTREELEEFCSLKIVESVMDRCNLSHLKTLIEKMADTVKEYENEIMLLSKQNNVLQLAVNSVNDEQKNSFGTALAPLKITRSVGMQVLMTDKPNAKKKNPQVIKACAKPTQPSPIDKTNRNSSVQKLQKNKNQSIPVPRLVPAANTSNKTSPAPASNTGGPGKFPQVPPVNGVRNSSPVQKPEKRSRVQSETVDLTDDEPPLKVTAKSSPASGVRLVPAQNLLPQRPQFVPPMTSPRKVYIPISGPQSQNVRPEQTVVLKTVPPSQAARPKAPANNANKVQANTIRMNRPVSTGRHPAPLPDVVKQYQPTSWKALPPAPDLKLSKVENGIVISWKIDGYDEDSYEEITSYQLFAYHETSCPPSTAIWKKIGDVKALPLPMACTLTQFLAGYKYYFAVRAVDIKSRFGPFSLPASILLLNKI